MAVFKCRNSQRGSCSMNNTLSFAFRPQMCINWVLFCSSFSPIADMISIWNSFRPAPKWGINSVASAFWSRVIFARVTEFTTSLVRLFLATNWTEFVIVSFVEIETDTACSSPVKPTGSNSISSRTMSIEFAGAPNPTVKTGRRNRWNFFSIWDVADAMCVVARPSENRTIAAGVWSRTFCTSSSREVWKSVEIPFAWILETHWGIETSPVGMSSDSCKLLSNV